MVRRGFGVTLKSNVSPILIDLEKNDNNVVRQGELFAFKDMKPAIDKECLIFIMFITIQLYFLKMGPKFC